MKVRIMVCRACRGLWVKHWDLPEPCPYCEAAGKRFHSTTGIGWLDDGMLMIWGEEVL